MDRLPLSKRATQKTDMKKFNLKKVKEAEVREEYQLNISRSSAASENVGDSGGIIRAGENIRENIKILAQESLDQYERKQHKPWFDEECSKLLNQRR
jgi:hypothetical protein